MKYSSRLPLDKRLIICQLPSLDTLTADPDWGLQLVGHQGPEIGFSRCESRFPGFLRLGVFGFLGANLSL